MKTTLSGICLFTALSVSAGSALAQDAATTAPAARWSSSVMDRHLPLDAAQLQKLSQGKFRYMDMPQAKRSSAIRNAVIVHGKNRPGSCGISGDNPEISRPAEHVQPRVVMRPMT